MLAYCLQARQRIEELIESVVQREGRGGRGGGRDRYDRNRNGGDQQGYGGGGGWCDDRQRGQQASQEITFIVPSTKCGVIIGRGGETIKQINQQSGAYCELDRRSQGNQNEKTFIIRGEPEQVEAAKRIISEKVQIPLNFINVGMSNNLPTVCTECLRVLVWYVIC